MALQHLRSSTADKRPTPGSMSDGQLAMNTNLASPGLFFKDSNGDLVKVGPVHVGTTAPNVSPASGGQAGNSKGEQWLDTSSSRYVFKIWDGSAWRSEAGEFVDAAGDVMTGALGIIAGTAAAPGLYISGDTNTGIYSLGADQLALGTGGTGRLFIDDGGRIMAGTSTALTNAYAISTALTPAVQIQGNTANAAALSITRQTSAAANLLLQRGVTGTPVVDTDAVGQIGFNGFDGTNYFNAALIRAVVDGTPGTNSMPGRLSFQTTPTGSTTPVERLRLDPAGQILAASLGTAALPVWSFTGDPNTGIYSPGADQVAISTNGTGRLFVTNGRTGVNISPTAFQLQVNESSGAASYVHITNSDTGTTGSDGALIGLDSDEHLIVWNQEAKDLRFATSGTERARIDSSGRLLINKSSARSIGGFTSQVQLEGTDANSSSIALVRNNNDAGWPFFTFAKTRGTAVNGVGLVIPNDRLGEIFFAGGDGVDADSVGGSIACDVDGTPGSNDMPGRLIFSTTADGAAAPSERMRINSLGNLLFNTLTNFPGSGNTATGIMLEAAANGSSLFVSRSANVPLHVNRSTDDGVLIALNQDGTNEGSISVSGTTISYNGAHLSRWSQLPSGAERTEILRGSVLSNIDEMCEWGEEDNEQLNRMKVSDVEGDKNVSGVFQAWDDDDDTYTDDFYCAMTGDFIIRIAEGVTVERGDLLMSAGDGTAKPQDDDIIRSKTIAKVTSTNVSCTYDDGSYCVPCVLMAC